MGGTNTNPIEKDWKKAMDICYDVCDVKMLDETYEFVNKNIGVMVIVRNTKHQQKLYDSFCKDGIVKKSDIYLMTGNNSIFLTPDDIAKGNCHDYKIVIVTKDLAEGYTLISLGAQVSCVYFSNEATRVQLEGRINRIGQLADTIYYRIIHAGLLTYTLERYGKSRSLHLAIKSLSKEL